jgi:hypothetical protein
MKQFGIGEESVLVLLVVGVEREEADSRLRTTATRASRVHGSAGDDTGKAVRHQTS